MGGGRTIYTFFSLLDLGCSFPVRTFRLCLPQVGEWLVAVRYWPSDSTLRGQRRTRGVPARKSDDREGTREVNHRTGGEITRRAATGRIGL